MASEKTGYNLFPTYPVTGPATSQAFALSGSNSGAGISLGGTSFSARVQVSNALNPGPLPDHLFVPPDGSFDDSVTLTAGNPPQQIAGPIRWIRLVLDSGTLTGGNVVEQQDTSRSVLDLASLISQQSGNTVNWTTGDHTTLPSTPGVYQIVNGAEAGQKWVVASGSTTVRRPELEAVSQSSLTARIVTDTLDTLALAPGTVNGDATHYKGRTYFWDAANTEASNGVSVLSVAGTATGRWIITDRERVLNLLWFSALVVNGDWIPALNAALALGSVFIPEGTFLVSPSSTNYIKIPVGVPRSISGLGAGSLIKVKDGTGDYQRLFGSSNNSQPLKSVQLVSFAIDQNPDNNVGTIVEGSAPTAQQAIGFYNFNGVTLRDLTITGTGINTISLNAGLSGRNARILACDILWANKGSVAAVYDNSAIYINCEDHEVSGCTIRARSTTEGAAGAIETHGALGSVHHCHIEDFRDVVNIVPFSGGVTELTTNSQQVHHITALRCAIGIRVWPITGKTVRNIRIHDNDLIIAQSQYPAMLEPKGIYLNYSTSGTQDGDIDGLFIYDNKVEFEATEARTNMAYNSIAGIGLASNGNVSNAYVYDNVVKNAPFSAYVYGRAGKVITHLRAFDNQSINTGTATGQTAVASLRVAVNCQGQHIDSYLRGLQFIEDTATTQATTLAYFSLTAGSDVTFEGVRITAPNNASIVVPASPPTGVTFASAVSTGALNTFTKLQTVTATGTNALNATSDTAYALLAQSTSGVGVFGKSTSGYGVHGVSLSNNAVVAQQTGTATATANTAALYVTRTVAAGANNVTGALVRIEDTATVTTGSRFNDLVAAYWDGVLKLQISGGSHAMGAGILTNGGWGRLSTTLTPGAIAAATTYESADIAMTGVALGDVVSVTPGYAVEAGLVWSAYVRVSGQVRVRIFNGTAGAVTPTAAATWKLAAFRS